MGLKKKPSDSGASRLKQVHEVYEKTQTVQGTDVQTNRDHLRAFSENWKEESIPALQAEVVAIQLQNLRNGIVDPVFMSFLGILKRITLQEFSLLDAACASGYYGDVLRSLDRRAIQYQGSDYSEPMIRLARQNYPNVRFDVEDVTALSYQTGSIDVVLLSGALEHIPDFEKAIAETCRVANKYFLLHRCPLTTGEEHEYTLGSQYSIQTPRIFFSRKLLLLEIEKQNFALDSEVDTYPSLAPWMTRVKSELQKVLGRSESRRRSTKTILFKKRNERKWN